MRYVVAEPFPADMARAGVMNLSDIHRGNPACDEREWLGTLRFLESADNVKVVLNGDLFEAALRDTHGDISHAMTGDEELFTLKAELSGLAQQGKIIAMTTGNHEERYYKKGNTDLSRVLAEFLQVPYDPEGVMIKVSVGMNDGHRERGQVYHIWATHGHGAGRTVGGKANTLERMAYSVEGMDAYFVGHGHQLMAFKNRAVLPDPRNNSILLRKRAFVEGGSFLSWEGYAVRQNHTPSSSEMPIVWFSGREHRVSAEI